MANLEEPTGAPEDSGRRREAVCAFCGRLFRVRAARGRLPKYCRPSHRQRAYEERRLDTARESATDPAPGGPSAPPPSATDPLEEAGSFTVRTLIQRSARELLSERGLSGTTIRAIANRAGVAYGTVSYHFGSKEQLLLEVIRDEGRTLRADAERTAEIDDVASRRASLREELRTRVEREPNVFKLRFDLFALALRRQRYQLGLASFLRASRVSTANALVTAGFTAEDGELLAPVLQATIDGLALQALVDPAFDHDRAHAALMKLLGSFLRVRAQESGEAASA